MQTQCPKTLNRAGNILLAAHFSRSIDISITLLAITWSWLVSGFLYPPFSISVCIQLSVQNLSAVGRCTEAHSQNIIYETSFSNND